ncbi:MAG: hypothetical protein KBG28_14045 [Kofleriaceae bacterium]|nr:hypothetical protein [Kofleriaceae bacterium]
MRRALAIATLLGAGCRIGFDGAGGDGAGSGSPDAPDPACRLRDVAIGWGHACAANQSGAVYCWGENHDGAITGADELSATPRRVDLPGPAVAVAAGQGTSCALGDDARLRCWGLPDGGDPGAASIVPTEVDLPGPVTDVAASRHFTCARAGADGAAFCWGLSVDGELGLLGGPDPVRQPMAGTEGATSLTVGHRHGCVGGPDGPVCWGLATSSRLAMASAGTWTAPTAVSSLTAASQVALGGRHGCGLFAGDVRCWGSNFAGQRGDSEPSDREQPGPSGVTGAVEIAVGAQHSCARLGDGTVRCWGRGDRNELGAGTLARDPGAVAVTGLTAAVSLFAGPHASCAEQGGQLWCWGDEGRGLLGRGSRDLEVTPIAVATTLSAGVLDVDAEGTTLCAVEATTDPADRPVWCWGNNRRGLLGDAALAASWLPVRIAGVTGARQVALSPYEACARRDDGVVCWSADGGPVAVAGVSAPTTLALGKHFGCVVEGGQVLCWGDNQVGELGDGTRIARASAAPVPGLAGAIAVSARAHHACAVTTAGTLWCWGGNGLGVTGVMESLTPVQVVHPGGLGWRGVAVTFAGGAAIDVAGQLWLWYDDAPTQTVLPVVAEAVHASGARTCVLAGGQAWCLGRTLTGAFGTGAEIVEGPARFGSLTALTDLAIPDDTVCGLSEGALYCAGSGSHGELTRPPAGLTAAPVLLPCSE